MMTLHGGGVARIVFLLSSIYVAVPLGHAQDLGHVANLAVRPALADEGLAGPSSQLGIGFDLGVGRRLAVSFTVDYWKKAIPFGIVTAERVDTSMGILLRYYLDKLSLSSFRPILGIGPAYHMITQKNHLDLRSSEGGVTTNVTVSNDNSTTSGHHFGFDFAAGVSTAMGHGCELALLSEYRLITGQDYDRNQIVFVTALSKALDFDR